MPVEIKASKTYQSRYAKPIDKLRLLMSDRLSDGYLVYAGEHEQVIHRNRLINYRHLASVVVDD